MVNLNFKTFGEGKPIIFLHGLFGMLDNWQTFGKKVAEEGYMVYLIDQRDHGKSPFTSEFNYQLLAEDLKKFMEDNWLYKAVIVGHSMGGKTAMQFAANYEDMLDKLVVVDIAPKKYRSGHEDIFNALMSIDLSKVTNRKEVHDHLAHSIKEDESTIQFLLKNLQRNKEGGYRWKMNVDVLYQHYDQILETPNFIGEIETPTLFVRGGESNYIKEEDWPDIQKTFTHATLHTVEDAGHWIHAQKPDELFDVLLSFISQ
jgi:pimeloyl-ACP methyl ester carboxylesterase